MTRTTRTTRPSAYARPHARPDLTRPGVGLVKASTWRVGTPERQRAALDAIARTWESRPWPTEGLLSYTVHPGEDGDTLLHYSQWRSEEDYRELVRTERATRNAEIDAAVPGIERVALHSYEPYRSRVPGEGDGRVPGCVVTVEVEFDGPDPARRRGWVDAVLEALDSDPAPPPGGVSGHFHLGLDGARVLNYAEWESAAAHEAALAAPGDGVGAPTSQWRRVREYPGLVRSTVRRHTPGLSLGPDV
ncbi:MULTISPECIES: antibiotic biosynthesis monooxygenase [Streptomyces]|uniref:Antibiotic biosynthesis monooxygenase n=1 Tax=Streptomyces fradiae ATCC 10745 = DSM 40063 TaxID=1319510 RepID=A0A1Y2NSB4_STRFR|nr:MULTISPECIES: antibiotic biosynthesis monooxygenase [Streptomyces]KAF0651321.1 antibiotic biosynthesis monooxygenase [Streptomyces fradiae ATCC 10745 = DSM 40063]OSY50393.1 Antibiotic biosynthesis monooxygenase [Streptomyces fradiae ATCC 10745 = DSM 40063]QEV11684.1 antibiotic biosynthesis monooxygenase [Streptomyces fradiae ATCC 10745 = DSM 40063]